LEAPINADTIGRSNTVDTGAARPCPQWDGRADGLADSLLVVARRSNALRGWSKGEGRCLSVEVASRSAEIVSTDSCRASV
jgi:hypothetical protein